MYLDKNLRNLKICGKTIEGKFVVSGIFPLINSEGLSLEDITILLVQLHFRI